MSQRVLTRLVGASSAAVLILGLCFDLTRANAADDSGDGTGSGKVYTGDLEGPCEQRQTENKRGAANIVFELHTCNGDNWIPDVANADAESQDIALRTWQGLMQFCIKYPTLGSMKADGYGPDKPGSDGSHWRKDSLDGKIDGLSLEGYIQFAAEPSETITKAGAADTDPTVGIMANEGWGFPYVGKLMRPHGSHGNAGDDPAMEMIHLFCMPTIEGAMQYNEPEESEIPGPQVLQAALTASQTGGIAAVSTGLGGIATSGLPAATAPIAGTAADSPATATATAAVPLAMPLSAAPSRRGRIMFGSRSSIAVAPAVAPAIKPVVAPRAPAPATAPANPVKVNNTLLSYDGSWEYLQNDELSQGKYEKDSTFSSTAGDTATLQFNGSSLALVTTLDAHHGIVAISIDGGPEKMVDLYSPQRAFQQVAFQSGPLGAGTHTATLRVTGQSNAKSTGTVVTIDRVDVA